MTNAIQCKAHLSKNPLDVSGGFRERIAKRSGSAKVFGCSVEGTSGALKATTADGRPINLPYGSISRIFFFLDDDAAVTEFRSTRPGGTGELSLMLFIETPTQGDVVDFRNAIGEIAEEIGKDVIEVIDDNSLGIEADDGDSSTPDITPSVLFPEDNPDIASAAPTVQDISEAMSSAANDALASSVNDLGRNLAQAKEQYSSASRERNANVEGMAAKMAEITEANRILRAENTKNNAVLSKLQEENARLDKENTELLKTNDELGRDKRFAEKARKDAEQFVAQAREEVSARMAQAALTEQDAETKVRDAQAEARIAREKAANAEKAQLEAETQAKETIEKYEKESAALAERERRSDEEVASSRKAAEEAAAAVASATEQLKEFTEEANTQLEEEHAKVVELEGKLDEAYEKLRDAETKLDEAIAERDLIAQERDTLEERYLKQIEDLKKSNNSTLDELEERLLEMQRRNEELEMHNQALVINVDNLKESLREAKELRAEQQDTVENDANNADNSDDAVEGDVSTSNVDGESPEENNDPDSEDTLEDTEDESEEYADDAPAENVVEKIVEKIVEVPVEKIVEVEKIVKVPEIVEVPVPATDNTEDVETFVREYVATCNSAVDMLSKVTEITNGRTRLRKHELAQVLAALTDFQQGIDADAYQRATNIVFELDQEEGTNDIVDQFDIPSYDAEDTNGVETEIGDFVEDTVAENTDNENEYTTYGAEQEYQNTEKGYEDNVYVEAPVENGNEGPFEDYTGDYNTVENTQAINDPFAPENFADPLDNNDAGTLEDQDLYDAVSPAPQENNAEPDAELIEEKPILTGQFSVVQQKDNETFELRDDLVENKTPEIPDVIYDATVWTDEAVAADANAETHVETTDTDEIVEMSPTDFGANPYDIEESGNVYSTDNGEVIEIDFKGETQQGQVEAPTYANEEEPEPIALEELTGDNAPVSQNDASDFSFIPADAATFVEHTDNNDDATELDFYAVPVEDTTNTSATDDMQENGFEYQQPIVEETDKKKKKKKNKKKDKQTGPSAPSWW